MPDISPIAPCGINCSLCIAYQREKSRCLGCNGPDIHKPAHCVVCWIKICEARAPKGSGCCSCPKFPCKRIKQLDKRYRSKYGVSNIDNLKMIAEKGMDAFIAHEKSRWTCEKCGELLCMHRNTCLNCGARNPHSGPLENDSEESR